MGRVSEAPLHPAGRLLLSLYISAHFFLLLGLLLCAALSRLYLVAAKGARSRINSTRFTSGFVPVRGKYCMQSVEPPKDAEEGGRERDSLTFSGMFLVDFHQEEARSLDHPVSLFLSPPYLGLLRLAARPKSLRQARPSPSPLVGFSQLWRLGQGLGC